MSAALNQLALSGELNVYRAAELKTQLLQAVDAAQTLEIDLSEVSEIDSAGVQVLMLAKRCADQSGRSLRLVAHSAAVQEVWALMGLAPHFEAAA